MGDRIQQPFAELLLSIWGCANVTLTQLGGGETCEGQSLQGESKVTSSVVTMLHLQTFLKHCHFVPNSRREAKIATRQPMAAFPFSHEEMDMETSMTCQRSPAECPRKDPDYRSRVQRCKTLPPPPSRHKL